MTMQQQTQTQEIIEIDTDKISTNPSQPRKEFDKKKLKELADSIAENGLINPIQVKEIEPEHYEIVCGERRFRAHKIANIKKIKAIVKEYDDDSQMIESLIENLHRSNLNSVEKENYVYKLWETGKYSSKIDLAKSLGKSSSYISGLLQAKEIRDDTHASPSIPSRVLIDMSKSKLSDKNKMLKQLEKGKIHSSEIREISNTITKSPDDVKDALLENKITVKQAKNILNIHDKKTRSKIIKAHKEIKSIDNNIEKDVVAKIKPSKAKLIKSKELINDFRYDATESQKAMQTTIKSLLKCVQLMPVMDDNQIKQLKHYYSLFMNNLIHGSELLENISDLQ